MYSALAKSTTVGGNGKLNHSRSKEITSRIGASKMFRVLMRGIRGSGIDYGLRGTGLAEEETLGGQAQRGLCGALAAIELWLMVGRLTFSWSQS